MLLEQNSDDAISCIDLKINFLTDISNELNVELCSSEYTLFQYNLNTLFHAELRSQSSYHV